MKNDNTTKESKELVTKTKMKLWKKIVITILIFMLLAIIAFVTYEKATVNNTYYIGEKNLQIPVFVYHDIVGMNHKYNMIICKQHMIHLKSK